MIPGWKIRREFSRMRQQLAALPQALWEPVQQRIYDQAFPGNIAVSEGLAPAAPDVALLLIFQKDPLAESTLSLCQGLSAEGFAPLVVSNAPLSEGMRQALLPLVWRLVERPNYGYDFGGYRDGIRLLWHWKITPERLLILNDSVWLLDHGPARLIGALSAARGPKVMPERLRIAGVALRKSRRYPFLESYCYLIDEAVFRSKAFTDFWRGLRLTANKYKVIRRGERGFSRAMLRGGISLRPFFDNRVCLAEAALLEDAELARVLRHAAWLNDQDEARAADFLARRGEELWREELLTWLAEIEGRMQLYLELPLLASRSGYPFLKRSGDRGAQIWRAAWLRGLDAGLIPPPPAPVEREIRAKVAGEG